LHAESEILNDLVDKKQLRIVGAMHDLSTANDLLHLNATKAL
jgi:hypothetical protein